MPLEIIDLGANSSLMVPEDGLTMGREGGTADYKLKDPSVSKRHARVFLDGGEWILEDLGSSNGTKLGGQNISAPTPLRDGDVFTLGKQRFEVVGVAEGDGGGGEDDRPPTPPPPPKPGKSAQNPVGPSGPKAGKVPSKPAPGKPAPPALKAAPEGKRPTDDSVRSLADDVSGEVSASGSMDGAESKGVGYFFIAVPKAIAFYLGAIPLLLVNPLGTVRKGIEDQKHNTMGRMELIAYAIPPLLLTALLGSIATGIALAVRGTFSLMSFIPIGPAIGGLVGAVVTGFIFHPVLSWVVEKLKGHSDGRSRTNFFLMTMTVSAVLAVPGAVATLLSLIPFRLIAVVGILLQGVATAASIYVFYAWFTHFQVVKWFRMVILVLGGLGLLGTLGSGVSVLISGAPTATTGNSGEDGEDLVAKAKAEYEAKMKEAQAQVPDADKPDADKPDTDKPPDAKKPGDKSPDPVKAGDPKPPPADPPPDKPVDTGTKAAPPPPPDPTPEPVPDPAPPPDEPAPAPSGKGYPAWKAKRDFVEKKLAQDPTLLRNKDLAGLYKKYISRVHAAETTYRKASAKRPEESAFEAHMRDVAVYEGTQNEVLKMYEKLKDR